MSGFPIWVLALDYVLGIIMWTLIGRTAMSFFLPETSYFFFMRAFVKLTDPVMRVFKPITPKFLLERLHPLYAAWFFYMARFYVIPLLFGYNVMGVLSFPLESEIALGIYELGNTLMTKSE